MTTAMRSLPLLPDMAANLVRLHEKLPVECTEDAANGDGFQPQRALVEQAIRGVLNFWRSQFPPMPESQRRWPLDFSREERAKPRQLAKTTMLEAEAVDMWKKVVESDNR
jgi:hypothetical protein